MMPSHTEFLTPDSSPKRENGRKLTNKADRRDSHLRSSKRAKLSDECDVVMMWDCLQLPLLLDQYLENAHCSPATVRPIMATKEEAGQKSDKSCTPEGEVDIMDFLIDDFLVDDKATNSHLELPVSTTDEDSQPNP
eukprot:gb/GEZN01013531.1/.p1 GENE.gb/GEZN01013531.1/~~gb/GEZN01013531.1/.p1  ORF type:complete len:136 (+),score=16.13 gb/GEZN01013531.1/:126-533(+)